MGNYFKILSISFAIAIIDFMIKGTIAWYLLPDWLQGWSWHLTILFLFLLCIAFLAYSTGDWYVMAGVLSWINEDVFYYVFKSIAYNKLFYNDWLFRYAWIYAASVIILNAILILLLVRGQRKQRRIN